ncbi:MAG: DUF4153 domain-containing protein [Clostridiaceae bacterium]|nr:DUF4153 domain-containing protein [Clostridiaceae bacterium]
MKNKLTSFFTKLTVKLWQSLKRFPLPVLMAASTVILIIVLNHLPQNTLESTRDLVARIALVFALGFPLFLSINVFLEGRSQIKTSTKNLILFSGSVILALYFVFLFSKLDSTSGIRYSIYTGVLYLMFLYIPKTFKKESYELYVVKLFTSFVTVLLYSIILFIGVAAIIGSTVLLFKLSISGEIYIDIATIIFGLIAPVLFLSEIPAYETILYLESYPKVLKILFLYIILPILSIFLVIFYLYFATILFKPWPSNIIFRIAFYFLITSIVALFFTYPLTVTNKWGKVFTSIYPKLLLPLVVLMFMSLWIRLSNYGVTNSRYFLVIAAIWIAFSLIYLSLNINPKNIILLISLSILLFLSATGPWNFSQVTKMSQSEIFKNIIVKYDMLLQGKVQKSSKEINLEDKVTLTSILNYYENHYDLKGLNYLPVDFSMDKMKDVFGFEPEYYQGYNNTGANHQYYNSGNQNNILNIKDYDYIITIFNSSEEETLITKDAMEIILKKSDLIIKNNGKTLYNKNLSELAGKIYSNKNDKNMLTTEELTIKDGNENLDVVYVFDNLDLSKDLNSNIIQIYSMNLKLLVKFH